MPTPAAAAAAAALPRVIAALLAVILLLVFAAYCRAADDGVFPILCWELPPRSDEFGDPRHGLASLKECGFTVAAFPRRPEHLAECDRLGLRAILGRTGGPLKWEAMSDGQIEREVQTLVDEARDHPAVMGYFITDEPGAQKFPALAKAVAAVKRLAPGKLAYVNLYPDYATIGAPNLSQLGTASYEEYLDRFVREVRPPLLSYDNYRVLTSLDLQKPEMAASYYHNLLSVRAAALKADIPFWIIVSGNQIRPYTPVPSPANLLFQAYTSLAAGSRGLTWFTYYGKTYGYPAIDKHGNRTATWSYLRMVNEQVKTLGPTLLTLRSTGVYFTAPSPAKGLPGLPGKLVGAVESPTPVMLGEFAGPDKQAWVMLVNLSLRDSAKVKVQTADGAAGLRVMSPVDGSLAPLDADHSIWLAAGQGALIRVR